MKKIKKEFIFYNDYIDCLFQLKWLIVFFLGELMEVIKEINDYYLREVECLF